VIDEKELEIECPHCGCYSYITVDGFHLASTNEYDCESCGEKFYFSCKAEITLGKVAKTEEECED
jgi:transposase-like protein